MSWVRHVCARSPPAAPSEAAYLKKALQRIGEQFVPSEVKVEPLQGGRTGAEQEPHIVHYACTLTHARAHAYAHIRTHARTRTRTLTHTHTHTHTRSRMRTRARHNHARTHATPQELMCGGTPPLHRIAMKQKRGC